MSALVPRALALAFLCAFARAQGLFDAWQQVFGQAWSSYQVGTYTGNQSYLQSIANKVIPTAIAKYGPWRVVYGPAVYKANATSPNGTADNTWFVSYHDNLHFEDDGKNYPTYVISIAGTEGTILDVEEDWDVSTVVSVDQWTTAGVPFPPAAVTAPSDGSTAPYVSAGSAGPVANIMTLPTPRVPTSNLYLWLRLQSRMVRVPTKFIFTGHSLGGALSSVAATIMVRTQSLIQSDLVDVRMYPIAGPSTGNQIYSQNISQIFPSIVTGPQGYKSWNLNIVNNLDAIPLMWCAYGCNGPLTIDNLAFMYMNDTGILAGVSAAELALSIQSARSGMYYYPSPYQPFQGIYPSSIPASSGAWAEIADEQHVEGYCLQFFGYNPC